MIHHQVHQSRAIHQHNAVHRFSEVDSVCGEARGRDEYPTFGFLSRECSIECLQFRPAYCIFPALGLNVNLFQSQLIERDDAIDTGVTRATAPPSGAAYLAGRDDKVLNGWNKGASSGRKRPVAWR